MLDPDSQTILLLSARFSKAREGELRPLTPSEYGRLAAWLKEQKCAPKDLHSRQGIVQSWVDPKGQITSERLADCLAAGSRWVSRSRSGAAPGSGSSLVQAPAIPCA